MTRMTRIQRIIDSIPETEFLGVMATDIDPCDAQTCLVCRLVSPLVHYLWTDGDRYVPPFNRAAELYGLKSDDMRVLFWAAADATAEVEEAIAARLNRIIR